MDEKNVTPEEFKNAELAENEAGDVTGGNSWNENLSPINGEDDGSCWCKPDVDQKDNADPVGFMPGPWN